MKVIFICASAILIASPALAGKSDDIAACAWAKMPTTTEKYRVSQGQDEIEAFMKIAGVRASDGSMNLKALKKAIEKSRPSTIGPDTQNPAVFVQHGATN